MKKHLILTLSAALSAGTVFADLLTYEGFDYSGDINGKGYTVPASPNEPSEGQGWRAPDNPTWTSGDAANSFTSTTGLSYADAGYATGAPSVSGNALTSSGASTRITRLFDIDSGGVWDNAGLRGSGNFIGGTGVTDTFYGSMLVSSSDWSSSRLIVEFQNTSSGERPRLDVNGGFALTNTNAGVLSNPEGTTPTLSETYLVVFEFNLVGTDSTSQSAANGSNINFWVNPTASATAPVGNVAQILATRKLIEFNKLDIRNIGGGDVIVDELRFGTTWGDVAPVPEPSAYGLIAGILALSWVMVRRRA